MFSTLLRFGDMIKNELAKVAPELADSMPVGKLVHQFHTVIAPTISTDLAVIDSALQTYMQANANDSSKQTPSAIFAAGVEWARGHAYDVANQVNAPELTVDKAIEVAQDVVDVANKAVEGDYVGAAVDAITDVKDALEPEQAQSMPITDTSSTSQSPAAIAAAIASKKGN